MAEVARVPHPEPDIDYQLDYQFGQWGSVPEYVQSWSDMDGIDREVFHLEWVGITESRLRELRQWAERDLLTPAQRKRYHQLLALVAKHRPTLELLLRD